MTLHQFNQCNTELLNQALTLASNEDVFLFYEDAVYLLKSSNNTFSGYTTYAIQEDVIARGITDRLPTSIQLINYDEWVTLTENHKSIAWH